MREMLKIAVATALCGMVPATLTAALAQTPPRTPQASTQQAAAPAQPAKPPLSANAQQAAAQGGSFTDPTTNQRWTGDNMGEGGRAIDPSYRAFDPAAQVPSTDLVQIVIPKVHWVGRVPITAVAGAPVPLAEIDNLQLLPDTTVGRWQVVFYLQNNSPRALSTAVTCEFQNSGNRVAHAVVFPPPPGPGDRYGVVFHGPPTTIFVDKVNCRLASP